MAWSNSKVFAQFMLGALDRTTAFDLDGDTFKAALYNNSITPDNTVSLANTAYNVGQWASANEVSSVGQWAAAGVALTSPDVTTSSTTITWDASDTASGSTATLSSVFGVLVYDDTIAAPTADPGVSYNYLGGSNSVVSGTFTVVWNASGIASFSVA